MIVFTNLREVAEALENGPEHEELSSFLEKFDRGTFDFKNETDFSYVKTILAKCTHVRGYQDYYIEKYDLSDWARLLDNAADEIRAYMNENS